MFNPLASTHGAVRTRWLKKLALAPMAAALLSSLPAQALTIIPTFDTNYDATAQATINSALSFYHTTFIDSLTVYVNFVSTGTGLGTTSQSYSGIDYGDFQIALRNDASSANDTTALTYIPNVGSGSNAPVAGTSSTIWLTRANAAAVGITVGSVPDGTTAWDATIDLNLSLLNYTRTSIDPDKYDLKAVAMHELNEVLGTTSQLPGNTADIAPMDLFRYDSSGNRSFTTVGDDAYFSIDGTSLLARFNQDPAGDFGDFWSQGGHTYQVQDAFSTPGVYADMNVETAMLDVVGYTLAPVPEPETYAMMLAGLALVGFAVRRRSV